MRETDEASYASSAFLLRRIFSYILAITKMREYRIVS